MSTKQFNTRIITKHADLETFEKSTLTLLEGEIVLGKVLGPQPDGTVAPTFVAKVGNGSTFANSPWLFAKASDVYSWAKKEKLALADIPEISLDSAAAAKINSALGTKVNTTDFETYQTTTAGTLSGLQQSINNINTNLSGYATDGELAAVEKKANDNAASIAIIMGDATKDGSIAKALAEAKSYADGLVQTEQGRAMGVEAGLNTRLETAESKLNTIQGTGEGSISKAVSDAQSTLQGNIDKKVDTATYNAKMTELEGVDASQAERITTLENKVKDVSNVMDFVGAVTAKPADGSAGYQSGDVVIVTSGDDAGKEYVYDGSTWHEFGYATANESAIATLKQQVETLETKVDVEKVSTAISGAVAAETSAREGAISTVQGNINSLSNTVSQNKTSFDEYVTSNNEAVEDLGERLTTAEGEIDTLQSNVESIESSYLRNNNGTLFIGADEVIFDCGGAE